MPKSILLLTLLLFTACEERAKPVIKKSLVLHTPIACLRLSSFSADDILINHLKGLYGFDEKCSLSLTLSYKKDIVCNSSYNAMSKNMGKFPKSFIRLELRQGMGVVYSYYVDLYSNVDKDDVEEGFLQLKRDILIAE